MFDVSWITLDLLLYFKGILQDLLLGKAGAGQCELCERQSALTAHHLIPRKLHRRKHFRKHFEKAELQATILICRMCHSGLHTLFDEMYLGKTLNSVDKLMRDPQVKKHISWVARQRTQ